jgi:uncharacterized protein YdhG (YjbR/CyaY superfamily)
MSIANAIDEYIAGFPPETQRVLQSVRRSISDALPGAEEAISYQIPTFRMNGNSVVYFAGYKNHVGIYPVHNALPEIADVLEPYLSGKATAKFPLDRPVPLELVTAIAQHLARANIERTAKKKGIAK